MSMINHKGKILRVLSKNIVGSAASPAAEHLFKVRDEKNTNISHKIRLKVFIVQQQSYYSCAVDHTRIFKQRYHLSQ